MNAFVRMAVTYDDTALVPDKGPPRVIRFDLPNNDIQCVAVLDYEKNLLRINKFIYEELSDMQQDWVFKTKKQYLYVKDLDYL